MKKSVIRRDLSPSRGTPWPTAMVLSAVFLLVPLSTAIATGFASAPSMNVIRSDHTATLLPNGKVLVAGGGGSPNGNVTSTEIYDPVANTWALSGSMAVPRGQFAATLLPNGKVLVVGGTTNPKFTPFYTDTAELFNPATNSWSSAGKMSTPRRSETVTLLPSGKVLVAGGDSGITGKVLSSVEIYDPTANTWSQTRSMAVARTGHTATLLTNGKVLIVGGFGATYLNSAELYDPVTETWSSAGTTNTSYSSHTATMLPSGKVLVAGGNSTTSGADIYDPVLNTWTAATPQATVHHYHVATLLPNGTAIVIGGDPNFSPQAQSYDPTTNAWVEAGSMIVGRSSHTATKLTNGKILVAGGENRDGDLASAELYDPPAGPFTSLIVPNAGLWWNPAESGSGYNFDFKNGILVMTLYSYKTNGESEWYLAFGPVNGATFTSTLYRYTGGPCIASCNYTGFPNEIDSGLRVSIQFASPTSAQMTLPGGRVIPIQPQAW